MKLTRGEFKMMIKECIKELIKDGSFAQALSENFKGVPTRSNGQQPVQQRQQPQQQDPYLAERARSAARRMAGADAEFVGAGGQEQMGHDYNPAPERLQNKGLQNLVDQTALSMAKGDQKLAESYAAIFADTAMHTLPKMMAQDPNRAGYGQLAAAGMQAHEEQVAPEQLQSLAVGGDITRWAALALGGGSNKK